MVKPKMSAVIATIEISRHPRGRNWARTVEKIDPTKPGAYALEGRPFKHLDDVTLTAEATPGQFVIFYSEAGSHRHGEAIYALLKVTPGKEEEYELGKYTHAIKVKNLELIDFLRKFDGEWDSESVEALKKASEKAGTVVRNAWDCLRILHMQ